MNKARIIVGYFVMFLPVVLMVTYFTLLMGVWREVLISLALIAFTALCALAGIRIIGD